MEPGGIPGGIYTGMGSGMLGLEMSLHHHLPQQPPQTQPHQMQQQQHPHPHQTMVGFGGHLEGDHHPQAQQSVKQGYQPYAPKPKNQSLTLSDDEDPGHTADNSADDAKRKMSPWQRMKWTDSMVKLLIMVVYYIGDEAGSEGNDPAGKKKSGGVLQKKGKWKSVSRAMMERGFYVSPQQCEDKFNDLNKRYKRVNDILGKGTACKVVENQSLLETMDLSPKMKEEVKKLLNSKHLFFREMCAYHNSCGHAGVSGGAAGGGHSPEVAAEPSHNQQSQQQQCLHSSANATAVHHLSRPDIEGSKISKGGMGEDEDDEEDDDDDDDDDDEEEEGVVEGSGRMHEHSHEEDDEDERTSRKRQRNGALVSPLLQQLSSEMSSLLQDGTKSPFEKKQWIKGRLLKLEEQNLSYHSQAFELEKQRLKWLKFSGKKEREMEKEKLTNERMKLENERMVILLRQKELELLELHQQQHQCSSRKSDVIFPTHD